MLAELLVGGRPHGAQFAARKRGFEQVGRIHGPTGSCTGTDDGVNFVDEQHGVFVGFQLGHDGLEALFEIAAVAGAGQQRAHIERIDRGVGEYFGCFTGDDFAREPFCDSGFTDTGITHQQRVVLTPAAQHLNATFHLVRAADQRIDITLAGFGIQIDSILRQRGFFFVTVCDALGIFLVVGGTRNRAWFAKSRVLGDAMRDIVHRIITRHVLLLQEIGRVAFAFGKDGDQHIGTRHLGPARRLHVDRRALDHPLEGCRGYRFGTVNVGDQIIQVFINEFDQRLAQFGHIDRAGFHHLHGVGFVDQGQ